ncbi:MULTISPECIES: DUF5684 domain-containing protein [Microbacterium]|uniref:DUF5684 domain-containing protein n=1 Tax=Microbacterium TaxID=33882 RepID=UPI0027861008|nr:MULTISPECIES: DUF5684 domain-containing protein [Microbacterium]MDQ1073846.1 hypothetical protein [Microbacterium sp. SORGH_AS_0969]MDQ1114074.1 hypothetical protein [Microbacterium testaceum]
MDTLHLAYSDPYGASDAAGLAALGALYAFSAVLGLIGYAITAFLAMKVFERAGVEGKWRAWVPVYNYMVFAKLGDVSPWVILGIVIAGVIPILNFLALLAGIVVLIMASVRVNAKFGREWPILLLFLLNGLGVWIWLGILGFSSNRWNPAAASPSPWGNSFLADKTVWNGVPVQPAQQGVGANAAPQGYGAPQGYSAPPTGSTPPAAGATPPPPAPPATGTTPPPPAPPAGPLV